MFLGFNWISFLHILLLRECWRRVTVSWRTLASRLSCSEAGEEAGKRERGGEQEKERERETKKKCSRVDENIICK